jgi:hypothetical protein
MGNRIEELNARTEMLIDEIKSLAEENIVIVHVIYRPSEGYYNYKTRIIVVYKMKRTRYDDSDIRYPKILTISAGVHQDYPLAIDKIIAEELPQDYYVETIDVF